MKAVFVNKFGLENPMILEEIDTPEPKSGQLLIKLGASGVNPSDVATRSGKSHHSSHMKIPYIPGLEACNYDFWADQMCDDCCEYPTQVNIGVSSVSNDSYISFLLKPNPLNFEYNATAGSSF